MKKPHRAESTPAHRAQTGTPQAEPMNNDSANNPTPALTHVDARGEVRMVDVGDKQPTTRTATASARLRTKPEVLDALLAGGTTGANPAGKVADPERNNAEHVVAARVARKGDALATARIAAIMAAKRTSDWIPLCHPLALDWVRVCFARIAPDSLLVVTTARTTGKTGVEMEALTAASAAALTLYDMAKAADRTMTIGPIQLEHKAGGRSGEYRRET